MATKLLIKLGQPFPDQNSLEVNLMKHINGRIRSPQRLCSGQALLCSAPCMKVPDWIQHSLKQNKLALDGVGYYRDRVVLCKRQRAPRGNNKHLRSRFVGYQYTPLGVINLMVAGYTTIKSARSFTKTCSEVLWVSAFVQPICPAHQAATADLSFQAFSA
jgi:hypothetical protein